ncbi:MAG: glycosyltransferase [Flavobacteriales bacterium]|nr:glycosyltransferase [Flavobacteriales bacterium]
MKVLFVSRAGQNDTPHPFVREQAEALLKLPEIDRLDHYLIKRGGIQGYLVATWDVLLRTRSGNYDVIHGHYGLSALPAMVGAILSATGVLRIATFHGSDLNDEKERKISQIASRLANWSVVVSDRMKGFVKGNVRVIPCGIDINHFEMTRDQARSELCIESDNFIVLFCSSFERQEKDPEFAKRVVELFRKQHDGNVVLMELKGMTRNQVTRAMIASDVLLMCSTMEGSPQVIKEAVFNKLPVLANDVGEVSQIVQGVSGTYVVAKEEEVYVKQLIRIAEERPLVSFDQQFIETYDNRVIASKLYALYCSK